MSGASELEKSLLDVERKHGISLEQADWETRGPQTEVHIDQWPDCGIASIPFSVIREKWGFMPSKSNIEENKAMHDNLRTLAHLMVDSEQFPTQIPTVDKWDEVVYGESVVGTDCVLIFW